MNKYDSLNNMQQEAVYYTEGPLLILAGAGSGKTRVLTHRIAYLIEEKGVNPWNILAITFTNKAAQEMRDRVDQIVGFGAESVWVSTFHSACVRILRRYIDRLGYDNHFTIYDTDDQKTLLKEVSKQLNLNTKNFPERMLMSAISRAKDKMISPEEYRLRAEGDWKEEVVARVYDNYQRQLRANNALDFDDLLMKTVELFQNCPDVLSAYQERFRYIMVDEYQDTNRVQFQFIRLLAERYQNLCVVGDDDQSIYKFRGADIGNILGFEQVFSDTKVVKLEQNYRSTQNILRAANEVIHNNIGRKDKTLWTANEEGEPIQLRQFQNAFEEAEYVVGDIARKAQNGTYSYRDSAVLYRTNAQSRLFEEKLLFANIPYKIVGGVNFYARKEIKDILAYLKTIDNGRDDISVRRIINVPKRGIGLTTISKIQEYAQEMENSFYETLKDEELKPILGRSFSKLASFVELIQRMRSQVEYLTVAELLKKVIDETGYVDELKAEDTEEARTRIENIDELVSKAVSYDETTHGTLSGFLEEVALIADIDTVQEGDDRVLLMTLHSAKGLEFPNVYLAGMEDGLFPNYMIISSEDIGELEEERRLCYVGMTRAMKELTLTAAQQRMVRGETQYNKVSRFVREIPRELVELKRVDAHFASVSRMPKPAPSHTAADSYAKMRQSYQNTVFQPKQFEIKKSSKLDYAPGDVVRHLKFGTGTVQTIVDGGKDFEVTVDFDKVGVKKMFASFAKLKKV